MAMAQDHQGGFDPGSAAEKAQREIEDLRRQLKELTDKYGPAAQSALEDVSAQSALEDVRRTVEENMGDIERQIREKPVQATLIAAGVGFLIGALLTR
jgi:ElaB/YqjD/DUF883 family membrane-anchored ribosome-binding protein